MSKELTSGGEQTGICDVSVKMDRFSFSFRSSDIFHVSYHLFLPWMLSRWRCLSRQEQAWVGGSCRGQPLPAPSTGLVGTRECLGTGLAYKPEGQRVPRRLLTCPREEARPRGRGRHPQWAWPGGLGGARRRPTRQRGDTLPLPGFSELWVSWAWGCPAAPRLTP